MESVGVFLNEEWDSLTKMFSTHDHQQSDFAMHFMMIGHDLFPSSTFSLNNEGAAAHQEVDHHETNMYNNNSSDYTLDTTNYLYFSQEISNSSTTNGGSNNISSFPTPNADEKHHHFLSDANLTPFLANNMSESMDFSAMDDNNNNNIHNTALLAHVFTDHVMEDSHLFLKEEVPNVQMENSLNLQDDQAINDPIEEVQRKRKFEQPEPPPEDNKTKVDDELSENPKKKPRVSRDQAQKNKKKAEPKKKAKNGNVNGESENNNMVSNGQSSSSYSSEEDDSNGGAVSVALNSNGKARASRGSATDPQSLYARKRRERINERLRILQNLVPNGTKVDISTMLEEAVHFIKFLQLQIKLLSSDDLWMYAPIAYNGMDMGLYQKISISH